MSDSSSAGSIGDYTSLPIFEETGYVVIDSYDQAQDPREWEGLHFVDWKSSGDTRFAPLASAYGEQRPDVLPFTFGYQYHDARDERSNVMVGRGPTREMQQASSDPAKGVLLRSSGRLGR